MLHILLLTLGRVALAVVLFCVPLFFGKRFVNHHVDGSRAMQQRGIHCARRQDSEQRRRQGFVIEEHSTEHTNGK